MITSPVQICAIAGGSGAGKTTLAVKMLERLGDQGTHLTIDWYYRDLSHLSAAERNAVNFDHPDSLETDLFAAHLETLQNGGQVHAPVYDFATHARTGETFTVDPRPFIVTEGIHLLGHPGVRSRCSLKVFIDVDADIRLERRLRRDVAERGRTLESVQAQWETTVAPMHDAFVQPSIEFADVVVDFDADLDLVADELVAMLRSAEMHA